MYDVITVGSATIDVFARTEFNKLIRMKHKDFIAYPLGSKMLIEELNITVGGSGTNAAVALSRLGYKVAFIGKIGSGHNSARVIENLKKEDVDTSFIVRAKKHRTGYSIILDSEKHDRTILAFKGSNNDLRPDEVKLEKLKTKWFYFSSMVDQSFKTLEKLAAYAKKNSIKVAFNTSPYLARKGPSYLKNVLNATEILVLNKEEAALMVGGGSLETMLKKLQSLGPKIVSITDGENGSYTLCDGVMYTGDPAHVKIVETTGAGDAFAATLLSEIIRKDDVELAVKLATTNAGSVIQHHGAKVNLLTYKQALIAMKKNPVKVTKKKI
jgi:ribokinase